MIDENSQLFIDWAQEKLADPNFLKEFLNNAIGQFRNHISGKVWEEMTSRMEAGAVEHGDYLVMRSSIEDRYIMKHEEAIDFLNYLMADYYHNRH